MPYPAQINRETIVNRAWERVEAEGLDSLSLGRLAADLGVKAPSLYRYIRNKAELLRAVNELTEARLFEAIDDALAQSGDNPREQIMALAQAYRAFAQEHPTVYTLAFTTAQPEARPDPDAQEAAAIPLQRIVATLSGEAVSLPALRGMWALIHGFVMLELSEQFRRGGDLEDTFFTALEKYLDGWAS